MKSFLQRIWRARLYPGFRDKLTHMVVDYLEEASVLVSVLGILDSVIAWRQQPSVKVMGWSLEIAFALFVIAAIIQAANEPAPNEDSRERSTLASREKEEETGNA